MSRLTNSVLLHGLVAAALLLPLAATHPLSGQMASSPAAPALGTGVLPQEQVERLLPGKVYFKEQSAPLQMRNAAAFRKAPGQVFWVSLVDTSGYSTGVRERYQFYLVTEQTLQFGGETVPAGAYGGGFLSDGSAILMDVGGRDVAKASTSNDADLRRPRPLQLVAQGTALRLYLGRQFVTVELR